MGSLTAMAKAQAAVVPDGPQSVGVKDSVRLDHTAEGLAGDSRQSQAGLSSRQILGIRFFSGPAEEAVQRMRAGGLLVAPAAPGLSTLAVDRAYRDSLLQSDVAIVDSSFLALLWNLLEADTVSRLSGLEYFSHLVNDREFRQPGAVLYVMASEASARRNCAWLVRQGIPVDPGQVYVAPMYGKKPVDATLLAKVEAMRPRHVVITVGGGTQECLGLYLKQSLKYRPAIHCIGAAIAFRSGDQVYIPPIADRLALGWLLRCLWRPKSYVPRYWAARRLAWLLYRYRGELPPIG
jgi:UDP-N-acetyl-D-mannosaminuronic acid transferase (WecB/TagA/CpsF family)